MGLDIYAGTLIRYYTHDWKTVVQQWAEANGYGFNVVRPNGEAPEEETLSAAEVRDIVEGWRGQLAAAMQNAGQAADLWSEEVSCPYYTDKPDWDAFGAMLLVAACGVYGEPAPARVPRSWDFSAHPAVQRLSGDETYVWSLLRGAIWWLPISGEFMFQAPLPNGNPALIGTVGGLRRELERLNQLAWQAEEAEIMTWPRTEGYPADDDNENGKAADYDTQSLAKFAYGIFWQALKFAEEHQVPILLDF